ncbi:MAG: hypothetical protein ACUZ8E_06145 [Candidatus Anammoxibacter sp.]
MGSTVQGFRGSGFRVQGSPKTCLPSGGHARTSDSQVLVGVGMRIDQFGDIEAWQLA